MNMPLIPDYPKKQIWAVGGGKGGTGKTVVAASIGILLAKAGKRVIIIDADLGGANLPFAQKQKLMRYIKNLDSDYVILDLGAGTSFNVLDLFLMSDFNILVAMPEPTSVENVYRFIKSVILRRLNNSLNNSRF